MIILNLFLIFLTFFWLIVFTKKLLFWVYLWQLKEYHLGRFIDHFRTYSGGKLIFNPIHLVESILILFVFFYSFFSTQFLHFFFWYILVILILVSQGIKAFYDIKKKNLKIPVLTRKTGLILLLGLFLELKILVLLFSPDYYWIYTVSLLPFLFLDFFTPLIFSSLVLLVHPVSIFWRKKLIKKAKEKREKFKDLLVIGITGSYGKTSTKEFLAAILSEKFNVLKTKEHQNSEVGISQCVLNDLNSEHQIFVVEMGAYNKGGIKLLCDIVQPKIGILTGINEQHMATFGSQKNIIKAKYELIESLPRNESKSPLLSGLPENGLSIFNANNKYCQELYYKTKKSKQISSINYEMLSIKSDLWAEDIRIEKEYVSFKVFSKDGDSAYFRVNLIGEQNIENILLAVLCARELGMELEEISNACRKFKPEQAGVKLFRNKGGLNIIDASYSSNPDGVISHLDYLKIWPVKKIIIMPCLIELGKASEKVHKRIGRKIGQVCDLAIITTKDRFEEIKKGAIEKGMPEKNILFMENPKEIFKKIKISSESGDVILLESRVPKELIKQLISIKY